MFNTFDNTVGCVIGPPTEILIEISRFFASIRRRKDVTLYSFLRRCFSRIEMANFFLNEFSRNFITSGVR